MNWADVDDDDEEDDIPPQSDVILINRDDIIDSSPYSQHQEIKSSWRLRAPPPSRYDDPHSQYPDVSRICLIVGLDPPEANLPVPHYLCKCV